MNRTFLSAALAAAALAPLANAQLGRQTLSLDLQAATSNNLHLGVVTLGDPSAGTLRIFTSNRGLGAANTAPHHINEWDISGNLVNTFPQPAATTTSVWGCRDGATDQTSLIFGDEGGIYVFDPAGNPVNVLNAAAGPQPITQPIIATGAGGGLGVNRGLAFNPIGNGGLGTLFVGDFGSDILEIDLAGNILTRFPNSDAWSVYGLAHDFVTDTLWINSTPNAGTIKQYTIDRAGAALNPTGLQVTRGQPGTAQGGLHLVRGGLDGRGCGTDLIGLDQGAPDSVYGYRLEQWANYDPRLEPKLLAGYDAANFSSTRVEVPTSASTLEIDLDSPGLSYFLFADVIGDPARGLGPIGPFRSIWEFTFPRTNAGYFGQQLSGTPFSLPAAAFVALPAGVTVDWQALVLDQRVPLGPPCNLRLPLVSTNLVEHTNLGAGTGTLIQAQGSNSFNAVTTSGFFSVTAGPATAGDSIVEVTFDFGSSSNPTAATTVFDLDQTGMANTFNEGNGGGCQGTYRNGSDVTCGLDYANANNNVLATATCTTSVAHCQGTSATSSNVLTWYFTPGSFTNGLVFEFDIDTDGGAGIGGDAMAGMVVTIKLQSGLTLSRELQVDPNVAQTASIVL